MSHSCIPLKFMKFMTADMIMVRDVKILGFNVDGVIIKAE